MIIVKTVVRKLVVRLSKHRFKQQKLKHEASNTLVKYQNHLMLKININHNSLQVLGA